MGVFRRRFHTVYHLKRPLLKTRDVSGAPTGAIAVTELADTLVGDGLLGIIGSVSVSELDDTLVGTGAVLISGTLNVVEMADSMAASGPQAGASTGCASLTTTPLRRGMF